PKSAESGPFTSKTPLGEGILIVIFMKAEQFPAFRHMPIERRCNGYFPARGMRNRNLAGVQMHLLADHAVKKRLRAAVFSIAHDRRADRGGMNAELMGAPSQRFE